MLGMCLCFPFQLSEFYIYVLIGVCVCWSVAESGYAETLHVERDAETMLFVCQEILPRDAAKYAAFVLQLHSDSMSDPRQNSLVFFFL